MASEILLKKVCREFRKLGTINIIKKILTLIYSGKLGKYITDVFLENITNKYF